MELRPYQKEAIESLVEGWDEGYRRLAVVLPTGAGKTVVFSHLIQQMRTARGIGRALVVAHREELLEQAAEKIKAVAPHLRIGIVKAGRNEVSIGNQVIVASIQTLATRKTCFDMRESPDGKSMMRCGICRNCSRLPRSEKVKGIGMIVVDECHHAAAPSYKRVLRHFGAFDEDSGVVTAGFTATLARDKGGLSSVWQHVAYRRDISTMIKDGYLVRPEGRQVVVPGMDLDQAKKSAGDFTGTSLAQLMLDSDAMSKIAEAYKEYASDRPGIVFSPRVNVAHEMTDAFRTLGIPTATVWGDMPAQDRKNVLSDFKDGRVQVISNCGVLTEGFDEPKASCLVVARPTMSPGLYVQMAGRVLRPAPGKTDALILDVTGVTSRHKLASIVDLTGEKAKENKPGLEGDIEIEEEEQREEPSEEGELIDDRDPLEIKGWREVQVLPDRRQGLYARWVKTPEGNWFTLGGNSAYFLVRGVQEGSWHKRAVINGEPLAPPTEQDPPMTMDEGMDELDRLGMARMGHWDNPHAPWRSRKASKKSVDAARRMGLPAKETMLGGEISDMIAGRTYGRKIDKLIELHERVLQQKLEGNEQG